MTLTVFQRGSASISVDAHVDRKWMLPATGAPGQATIRLPYSSLAASATYVNEEGGSWVEVADVGGCGKWIGIIRKVQPNETELTITAEQPWTLLADRVIRVPRTMRDACPVGHIALVALREGLSGLPWFRLGTVDEASDPLLPSYTLDGDVLSILNDLMDSGVNELFIDAETGYTQWCGALAGNQFTGIELFAGGNFFGVNPMLDGTILAAEVIAQSESRNHSVFSGATALAYPGKVVVSVDGAGGMQRAAKQELVQRSKAAVTLTGGVPESLWSIRERQFLNLFIPVVSFTGRNFFCRVVGRELKEAENLMSLTLQVVDPAIGVRVAPVSRGASSNLRGGSNQLRGTFRQRNFSILMRVWRLIKAHNDAN